MNMSYSFLIRQPNISTPTLGADFAIFDNIETDDFIKKRLNVKSKDCMQIGLKQLAAFYIVSITTVLEYM